MTAATTNTRRYSRTVQRPSSRTMQPDKSAARTRVCREAAHEVRHLGADLLGPVVVGIAVGLGHCPVDEVGDDLHLVGPHPLGGHRGSADPDAGCSVRRLRVERYGVLVKHDTGGVGAGLGVLAGHPDALKVMQ